MFVIKYRELKMFRLVDDLTRISWLISCLTRSSHLEVPISSQTVDGRIVPC